MIDLQKLTQQVIAISHRAGSFIQQEAKHFSQGKVEKKGSFNDMVSYVDKQSEIMIVDALKSLLPEAGFITEEDTPNQTDSELVWIIDPLDGTTNFVHGLPTYSVSIALARGNELLLGVVHEINRTETFSAWKDGGAYLNGNPIKISEVTELKDSLIGTGFPYDGVGKLSQHMAVIEELLQITHGVRRIGSAAVDLAYVACGRLETYFEYNLNPYDLAAGALIVKEAGGFVSDFSGGDNYLFGKQLLASGHIHGEMLKMISRYW